MTSGITWIRKRQRTLVKTALSLFAFAWLQTAIVPCAMAHAADVPAPAAQQEHCQYCPPAQEGAGVPCDHGSMCAFPHDPQIDARALSPLYVSLPCTFIVPAPALDTPSVLIAAGDVPRDVPRLPLAISYCRFIE